MIDHQEYGSAVLVQQIRKIAFMIRKEWFNELLDNLMESMDKSVNNDELIVIYVVMLVLDGMIDEEVK